MGFFDSKSYSTSNLEDHRIAADGAATVIRVSDGSTVHLQQGLVPDTESGGWAMPEGAIGDLLKVTQEQGQAARAAVANAGADGNQMYLLLAGVALVALVIWKKG